MIQTNSEQLITQQKQITEQIANLDKIIGENGEQTLLEAINQQRWYVFKNKREVVFDSHIGFLFPNFEYMSHISYNDWKNTQKEYAPNDIGKGEWQCLHDNYYCSSFEGKVVCGNFKEYTNNNDRFYLMGQFNFPMKFLGKKEITFYEYSIKNSNNVFDGVYYRQLKFNENHKKIEYNKYAEGVDKKISIQQMIIPIFYILKNEELAPNKMRLSVHEKSKNILNFFIEQDWIPIFEKFLFLDKVYCSIFKVRNNYSTKDFDEHLAKIQEKCEEYNHVFDAYYQRLQLQKQLEILEQQINKLPEPTNTFTSNFDYRQELENYNLTEINDSVLQYSLSAQQWLNNLLTQVDNWESSHQYLVVNAVEINKNLAQPLPNSLKLDQNEKEILTARHSYLQQHLNFSLAVSRLKCNSVL